MLVTQSPLTESFLHLCRISIWDVSWRAQVTPLCTLTPSRSTRAGVRGLLWVSCPRVVDHPHSKYCDVLSICLTTCTWRPRQNIFLQTDVKNFQRERGDQRYLLLPKLSWSVWVRSPFLRVEQRWQEAAEMWRDDWLGLIMLEAIKQMHSCFIQDWASENVCIWTWLQIKHKMLKNSTEILFINKCIIKTMCSFCKLLIIIYQICEWIQDLLNVLLKCKN